MKKGYLILILIGILYVGVMYFLITSKEPEKYLFLSEKTLLVDGSHGFQKANISEEKKVTLYEGSTNKGTYTIKKDAYGYFAYDSDEKEYLNYEKPIYGYTKDLKIEVLNFEVESFNSEDISLLRSVLQGEGISFKEELTSYEKIQYDFDNDGMKETVYAASNAFMPDGNQVFSVVYYEDDGEIQFLWKETGTADNLYSVGRAYLHAVLDYKKDGKIDLIFGNTYFDEMGTRYQMYQFDEKTQKLLFDIK